KFLYSRPEVINEISFEKKTAVENHILMSGDCAGMIAPLCGNGMAIALHSANVLSHLIVQYFQDGKKNRNNLEITYSKSWNSLFETRLKIGRVIQSMFGNELLTELMIRMLKTSKPIANWLVKQTHGKEF